MSTSLLYGLYDFVSEHEDEISFKADEPIVVIEADSEYMDGWWLGRNIQGKEGLFPRNYSTTTPPVTLKKKLSDDPTDLWDLSQVSTWLSSIGMDSLVTLFIEQEITGDVLLDLHMDSLKELGVSTYGKRYRIMQAITDLKRPNNSDTTNKVLSENTSRQEKSLPETPSSAGSTMYCFPRKAPLPPIQNDQGSVTPLVSPSSSTKHSVDIMRPLSPPSTISTTISRSNTLSSNSTRTSSDKSFEQKHPSFSSFRNSFQKKSSGGSKSSSLGEKENTPIQEHPLQEGWLYKQSDKYKKWDKRWFVLKEQHLYYQGRPNETRVRGIIRLQGYRIQADPSIHQYCFKMHHDRERTFYFYADTRERMKIWMNALMKATIFRDYESPVMSSNPVATIPLSIARQLHPRPPSSLFLNQDPMATLPINPAFLPQTPRASISSPICRTLGILSDEDEDLIDPLSVVDPNVLWINNFLSPEHHILSISTGLKNGRVLILLLEAISGKTIYIKPSSSASASLTMLDNMVAAFRFMGREGVVVDGRYTIKDILDGDPAKTQLLVEAIRLWAKDRT